METADQPAKTFPAPWDVFDVGYNSIIDPETSLLSAIGRPTKDVNFSLNLAIDPSGRWLHVADQKGDPIV
jgi:hypothetical protein